MDGVANQRHPLIQMQLRSRERERGQFGDPLFRESRDVLCFEVGAEVREEAGEGRIGFSGGGEVAEGGVVGLELRERECAIINLK